MADTLGDKLKGLQAEAEKMAALLREPHPGLIVWNTMLDERLKAMRALVEDAIGPSSGLAVSERAGKLVLEIAAAEGCSPQEYVEALLHYGASCHKRPGSWEANKPFDLQMYLSDDCFADKWF